LADDSDSYHIYLIKPAPDVIFCHQFVAYM